MKKTQKSNFNIIRSAGIKLRSLVFSIKVRFNKAPITKVIYISLAILIFGISVLSINGGKSSAYSLFTQTDWSGGVGSSTVNQYQSATNMLTGTSGQLTAGPATNSSSWCNTVNCDTNWTNRSKISVPNNSGQSLSDQQLKLEVNYADFAPYINSDFNDVRFTNIGGNVDYDYFLERKSDGVKAIIWVKVPTISIGSNYMYMYFGNNLAASASNGNSTMLLVDNFYTGTFTGAWTRYDPGNVTLDSPTETVTINGASRSTTLASYGYADRSTTTALDIDLKYDLSTLPNNSNCEWMGYIAIGNGSALDFCGYVNSDGSQRYFKLLGVTDATVDTIKTAAIESKEFQSNVFYRFRMVANESGGNDYYFSNDEGHSYIKINSNTNSSNNQDLDFGSSEHNVPTSHRKINVYKFSQAVNSSPITMSNFGVTEWRTGPTGKIVSPVIDLGTSLTLRNIEYDSSGAGGVQVKVRSSSLVDMSDSSDFNFCDAVETGTNLNTSGCVSTGDRYIQYQIEVADDTSVPIIIEEIRIEYLNDSSPPINASNVVIKKSSGGSVIPSGSWTNVTGPYFSWTAGTDEVGGSGLAGYCIYVGSDENADPVTTAGEIYDSDTLDVGGACQYATSDTFIDFSPSGVLHQNLVSGNTYYIIVKAIDNSGNISTDTNATSSFKYDNGVPQALTAVQTPTYGNSKSFTITWPVIPYVTYASDDFSGVAGVKYCVTNIMIGSSGCNPGDNNWYGKQHTSGEISDSSDVVPFADGSFTMSPADFDRIDLNTGSSVGFNQVTIAIVDNAGNYSFFGQTSSVITTQTSGAPENLEVTPPSNTANNFSFTWDGPVGLTLGENDYCWTVNDPIESDGSNCNWTGAGITQLANGPYATIQGTNTFRVMAKNAAGNFSNNEVASATFTASTTAPGPPQNTEISDVSTKATSTWKLALSWSAPDQVGAGVSSYKIFRSASANGTYTQVGSTSPSNLSFIDSGLVQTDYYYHVKACDSANSCSVAGNVVTKKPTGRYTTPASLTADTNQPKVTDIGTKKATITWGTSRDSDSKIAFGTKPGTYNPSEISNSNQTTDHSVSLTNLQPGTTYYYVARWTDEDGNTGASQERSFRTLDAPVVSDVSVNNLSISSGTVSFASKNSSKVRLYYGRNEGFGGLKEINTSTKSARYDIVVPELTDGSTYYYRLSTLDSDGNEYKGDIRTFTTLPRPRITNLRFQPVESSPSSTQKVSWTTNVPTTSSISYGPVGQKPLESLKSDLVTEHEITISGLIDNTDYNLTARSTDAAGITATSDSQTFKTALDTRPPKISDVSVETTIRGTGSEAKGQVIVSWKTDEKATSQVAYGQGQSAELTTRTPVDERLTTEHTIIVSRLPISSIIRIQPINEDKAGNQSVSQPQTIIIGRGSDNIFSIIFKTLQNVFRF